MHLHILCGCIFVLSTEQFSILNVIGKAIAGATAASLRHNPTFTFHLVDHLLDGSLAAEAKNRQKLRCGCRAVLIQISSDLLGI